MPPKLFEKRDQFILKLTAVAVAFFFIGASLFIIFGSSFLIDNNIVEVTLLVKAGFFLVFVELAASVVLLVGAILENKGLVIVWCIATIVVIIVQILFIILGMMKNLNALNQFRLQFMLCGDIVALYLVMLVYAYFQKLND